MGGSEAEEGGQAGAVHPRRGLYEFIETLANPYGVLGSAALAQMKLAAA